MDNVIPKSKLVEYYENHSIVKTASHFNTTPYKITKLLKIYGIEIRSTADSYAMRDLEKVESSKKILLKTISKQTLEVIYSNNSIYNTCRYFNTSEKNIYFLLDHYNIKRHSSSKNLIKDLTKQTREFRTSLKLQKIPIDVIRESLIKNPYSYKKALAFLNEWLAENHQKCISLFQFKKLCDTYGFETYSKGSDYWIKDKISRDVLAHKYEILRLPLTAISKEMHASPTVIKKAIQLYSLSRPAGLYPSSSNSTPNLSFEMLLQDAGIKYLREFRLYNKKKGHSYNHYQYDFKVDNFLIEINPSVTHNTTRGIRNGQAPVKDKYYHTRKSKFAETNGFKCLCVWDWTDKSECIDILRHPELYEISYNYDNPKKFIYDPINNCFNDTETESTLVLYDDGCTIVKRSI